MTNSSAQSFALSSPYTATQFMGRAATAFGIALLAPACIMLEADVPHACFTEQGVQIEVPVEQLDPEVLDALQQTSRTVASLVGEQVQQELPTLDIGDVLPVISFQESFSPEGLDALPRALEEMGATGRVSMLSVALDSEAGRFGFIERVALLARAGAEESSAPTIELAVCDVALGCDVSGERLDMTVATDVDLLTLLSNDEVELILDLAVRPFLDTLELDVEVCMAASAEVVLSL